MAEKACTTLTESVHCWTESIPEVQQSRQRKAKVYLNQGSHIDNEYKTYHTDHTATGSTTSA